MKNNYRIAFYLRISKEEKDGKLKETMSISHQRDMLFNFIEQYFQMVEKTVENYVDDGYSGADFDRPAFVRLTEDCAQGRLNCVLVKDLSRLGRNYITAGRYLEDYFEKWRVRVISLNDCYDSRGLIFPNQQNHLAFKNLVYDLYSKDLSMKIRSARKTVGRRGDFVSPSAIFGYIKIDRRLSIDPETAPIVSLIFKLAEEGLSSRVIAQQLNESKLPSPAQYKKQKRGKSAGEVKEGCRWTGNTVYTILKDRRYTGDMVSCKKARAAGRKVRAVPEGQWIIVPEVHEGIVTRQTFQRVQKLLRDKSRRK